MFVCPVLGLTPRAPGVEFCNCSRQSITIFLCQVFSVIHPRCSCANFLGHPSRSSCANFLGHPSRCSCANFLGHPSRSSCANFLGHPSRSSCAKFSRPSITIFLCQFFSAIRHDFLVPNFLGHPSQCAFHSLASKGHKPVMYHEIPDLHLLAKITTEIILKTASYVM